MIFKKPDERKTTFIRNFEVAARSDYVADYTAEYSATWREDILWRDIRKEAKTDDELQKVLERAKILYYLKKKDGGR